MDQQSNVRPGTLKLPQENMDIGIGNYFLNRTTTAQNISTRIDIELHQIKKFLYIKGNNFQNRETTH
jgi:hypothetical protein